MPVRARAVGVIPARSMPASLTAPASCPRPGRQAELLLCPDEPAALSGTTADSPEGIL